MMELINREEHQKILKMIDALPVGDDRAEIYRVGLEELFAKFNGQVEAIFITIKAYRDLTGEIEKRNPRTKRKKYVHLRPKKDK